MGWRYFIILISLIWLWFKFQILFELPNISHILYGVRVCVCVRWGGVQSLNQWAKEMAKIHIFFYFLDVIIVQESGNLVKQVEKSLLWRLFRIPVLIPLLVTVFQSESFILLQNFFHFSSYSILEAITFLNRKKLSKMSSLVFRAFSDPGFYFCFWFFRSVDLNKDPKRCLNALSLNLSWMWAGEMATFLGTLGWLMCNNVCQEVGTASIGTVKLTFFYLFRGDFLEIDFFFNIRTYL